MMKKVIIALAALAILAWGCSADDSDLGSDARPAWQAPNYDLFEQIMNVQVQMQDTLTQYVSKNDLLCATIDGEVRAVTPPHKTGRAIYYPLFILDNRTGGTISLHYYCDRLHRIYTINNWASFDPSAKPTGESDIYRPRFTEGN